MTKSGRQHRKEIELHIKRTFNNIVKKHEADEVVEGGEIGFLIAVIENFIIHA